MLKKYSGFIRFLIFMGILSAVAVVCVDYGYTLKEKEYLAEEKLDKEAAQKAIVALNDQLYLSELQAIEQNKINKLTIDDLQKKVKDHVSSNDRCNLTRGAVGLYNAASRGEPAAKTGLSASEEQQTSTVTQQTFVETCIKVVGMYHELAVIHDKSVDVDLKFQNKASAQ